jgi:hypothetical protein
MKIVLAILSVISLGFVNSCSKSGVDLKEGDLQVALRKCSDGKISGDKLGLCFDSLISDSRCPANAVCVWAGAAVAKFSLTKNGQPTSFTLSTLKFADYNKDTVLMGYKIEFVNLSPYPGTVPAPVPSDQIKAELKISKQ